MAFTNYQFKDFWVPYGPAEQVDDDAQYPLGTQIEAEDPTYGMATLIYLQCNSSAGDPAGSLVVHLGYGTLTTDNSENGGAAAVSLADKTSGQCGWYVTRGIVPVLVTGTMTTTYQRVYTSGTLGAISATQGSGTEVTEARNTTASGDPETGYALVYLDEAFVDTV